jgi:hypothetical protein
MEVINPYLKTNHSPDESWLYVNRLKPGTYSDFGCFPEQYSTWLHNQWMLGEPHFVLQDPRFGALELGYSQFPGS